MIPSLPLIYVILHVRINRTATYFSPITENEFFLCGHDMVIEYGSFLFSVNITPARLRSMNGFFLSNSMRSIVEDFLSLTFWCLGQEPLHKKKRFGTLSKSL